MLFQGPRFLRAVIDALAARVAVLDRRGRILMVNEGWRRFARGHGLDGVATGVGANYLEVCDRATGEDEATARAAAAGLRAVAAGEREFALEYPFVGPDFLFWFRLRATRFVSWGRVRVVVAHADVTALKVAEARLEVALAAARERARENELFRAMLDALPDPIFAKDPRGRFLAANAAEARILGVPSAAEILGRTDRDFYPPELVRRFRADEQAFYAGADGPVIVDQPGRRADGSPGRFAALKTPLRDGAGRLVGYVGHSRDVTEERRRDDALLAAYGRLRRQAESMRELAAAAGRAGRSRAPAEPDIRAPLEALLALLGRPVPGGRGGDATARRLHLAAQTVRRLLAMLDDPPG